MPTLDPVVWFFVLGISAGLLRGATVHGFVLLRERYYDNYAMILFVTDVAVLRPEKF